MALNNMGLGMIIRAKDMASAVFKSVGRSIRTTQAAAASLGKGMMFAGKAVQGAALGFAPFTLAMGFGVKKAADFEQGMANVRTIMRDVTDEQFAALSSKAKEMGATTSFTAREAADGMEILARQGFDTNKVLSAIGPTLKAAEVEGIDLATSAQLISSNLNAFGMSADKAGDVAGVLALASAKTATSMVGLGEGLKYVAPTAKQLGIGIEDTVAGLGLLANVGITGSSAGTRLNNMLVKVATASKGTAKKFEEMGVRVKDANGDFIGMDVFLGDLNKALPEIGGNMDQVKFLAEAMGLRGYAAASTLADSIKKMNKEGTGSVNAFKELSDQLKDTGTIVDDMSRDKLATMEGSFKILGSSIESVLIEGFTPLVKKMGPAVRGFADFVGEIAKGIDLLGRIAGGSKEAGDEFDKLNPRVRSIALGITDAMDAISSGAKKVGDAIKSVGEYFESSFGEDGLRTLVKWAAISGTVAAAIAPIAMAIMAVGFVLGPVFNAVKAGFYIFKGLSLLTGELALWVGRAATALVQFAVKLALMAARGAVAAGRALFSLAARFAAVGWQAMTAAARGIAAFIGKLVVMAAQAAVAGVRALGALALRFGAVMNMSVMAALRGLGVFIANTVRMAAVALVSGVRSLAALAVQFMRTGAAAVVAGIRGIAVFIANVIRMGVVAMVNGVRALVAMVFQFGAAGTAAGAAAAGGITSFITKTAVVGATSIKGALMSMATGFKAAGASAGSAALAIGAVAAAIVSVAMAYDQWTKLSKELGESGWSDMWKKLKYDIGVTSEAEYQRELGIQSVDTMPEGRGVPSAMAQAGVLAAPEMGAGMPNMAAALAGSSEQQVAAINQLGSSISKQGVNASFSINSQLMLDQNVLAEAMEQVKQKADSRSGRQ